MSSGFFAIDRGVWEHPMFAKEKFSEREAWLWMLSAAVWADTRIRVGKSVIDLQRGQMAFATRFLAEKWMWAHSKVVRFLNKLKSDAMIVTEPKRDATLITICNYDKYQSSRNTDETVTGTQPGTPPERQRNKEEELNNLTINKEQKKEPRASALVDDGWPEDFREQFWNRYPHKVGKPKALAKLEGIRKRAVLVPWHALMAGLDRYIRDKPPDRSWMNPETFLNGERWNDQPAQVSTGPPRNGQQGFESLFQQPEILPDELAPRSEFDLDLAANRAN
jgi:hypothetical protein